MADADARRIRLLCRWFERNARDLPWRRRRTGYTALVSEAMLQQTQVSRVVEKYRAFMRRFPSVRALAEADGQEVLAAWAGLGYYRRARNLHAAARQVVDEHRGRVPRDAAALRRLPGVGRYTAGAVASIVYGAAEPIVDGNVQRVVARWHGNDAPAETTAGWAWERATALVERAPEPGVLNEALMELGALVCTPAAPACSSCPVAADCAARRAGREHEIPPPRARTRQLAVHHHAVVVERGGRVLLEQRPGSGLWSSMWQPPTIEAASPLDAARLLRAFTDRGLPLTRLEKLVSFPYQTTHRRITFHVFDGATRRRRGTWRPVDAFADLPMSNAHLRVLERSRQARTRVG